MAQQAERGLVVPTREPDLDNANVGRRALCRRVGARFADE